ncbi:MAG: YchJ family protein [Pseudomonadota bacterium]|nr:YchJ family protein [Pseudomonadota bacterium]MDO7667378.1 YchJ family protein [Pseudomonadota bacterium]
MIHTPSACPCNNTTSYQACCQALHDGELIASSAEQLMRSRYSAFATGNITYLIASLHPDNRQADDEIILRQTIEDTQWLGLKIIRHKPVGNNATVEFVAFYQDQSIGQLHERSNFIKKDNQWFYVDGEILDPIKLSRNQTCFCGSGKKIKKCHNS